MSKLDPIKPYLDLIKGLGWVALFGFFFWIGGVRVERNHLKTENKDLKQLVKERDDAIAQRNAAQKKADELAKLTPKVVKSVRENPSGCSLAKPVADGLRKQVSATNDAIRAVP